MKIVFRFFFTLYAYFTFIVLMLIIFLIHVVVVLLVRKNRIHDARICFLKALELKPDYDSAKANLEKLQMVK